MCVPGEEHAYLEHWGEQMSGKVHPALCVLDIDAGAVSVLENIPEDVSPGQVKLCLTWTGKNVPHLDR